MIKQISEATRNVLKSIGITKEVKEQHEKEGNVAPSDSQSINVSVIDKEAVSG